MQNVRIRLNTQCDSVYTLDHIGQLEHIHALLLLESSAQGFQHFEQPGRYFLKAHHQAVAGGFPVQQISCQIPPQVMAAVAETAKKTTSRQQVLRELLQLLQRVDQAVPLRVPPLGAVQNQGFQKFHRNRIPVRPEKGEQAGEELTDSADLESLAVGVVLDLQPDRVGGSFAPAPMEKKTLRRLSGFPLILAGTSRSVASAHRLLKGAAVGCSLIAGSGKKVAVHLDLLGRPGEIPVKLAPLLVRQIAVFAHTP